MDQLRFYPRPEPVAPKATVGLPVFVGLCAGSMLTIALCGIVDINHGAPIRAAQTQLFAPPDYPVGHFVRPSAR